jgi:hypothetical protein
VKHPCGVECIEIVEHMTFNLGTALALLWNAGDYGRPAEKDLEQALWHLQRSNDHDTAFLLAGQAAMHFQSVMRGRKMIFNRPSPWCEAIRNAIAAICDMHAGRTIRERIRLTDRATMCIKQAIEDERCLGRGQEP